MIKIKTPIENFWELRSHANLPCLVNLTQNPKLCKIVIVADKCYSKTFDSSIFQNSFNIVLKLLQFISIFFQTSRSNLTN